MRKAENIWKRPKRAHGKSKVVFCTAAGTVTPFRISLHRGEGRLADPRGRIRSGGADPGCCGETTNLFCGEGPKLKRERGCHPTFHFHRKGRIACRQKMREVFRRVHLKPLGPGVSTRSFGREKISSIRGGGKKGRAEKRGSLTWFSSKQAGNSWTKNRQQTGEAPSAPRECGTRPK